MGFLSKVIGGAKSLWNKIKGPAGKAVNFVQNRLPQIGRTVGGLLKNIPQLANIGAQIEQYTQKAADMASSPVATKIISATGLQAQQEEKGGTKEDSGETKAAA